MTPFFPPLRDFAWQSVSWTRGPTCSGARCQSNPTRSGASPHRGPPRLHLLLCQLSGEDQTGAAAKGEGRGQRLWRRLNPASTKPGRPLRPRRGGGKADGGSPSPQPARRGVRQPAPRRPAAAACPRGGRPPLSRALLPLFQQGKILEKMGVCSKLAFTRYLRSGRKLGPDPRLWLGDARFGRVPVRVYRPRAPSAGPRAGAIFLHGGGWRYCGIGRAGRVVPALTAQLCAAAVIFWRRRGREGDNSAPKPDRKSEIWPSFPVTFGQLSVRRCPEGRRQGWGEEGDREVRWPVKGMAGAGKGAFHLPWLSHLERERAADNPPTFCRFPWKDLPLHCQRKRVGGCVCWVSYVSTPLWKSFCFFSLLSTAVLHTLWEHSSSVNHFPRAPDAQAEFQGDYFHFSPSNPLMPGECKQTPKWRSCVSQHGAVLAPHKKKECFPEEFSYMLKTD